MNEITKIRERNCLVLTQNRGGDDYNDFIGKFYHFPATSKKNYLKQFASLPIEFVYFESAREGEGVFYGYGRITKPPFPDKIVADHYFVEISDYKPFSKPVFFKDKDGTVLEAVSNAEHYNYRNAVRKINPTLLDELCLDGGIQLNFKADSHLVQVLGEQLIASERVGILELVKNAFDAGAKYCSVRIEKIPNLSAVPVSLNAFNEFEGPVIVVEDDGSGMTKEEIELGWLRPASTIKTNVKERLKTEREKAIREGKLGTYKKLLKTLKTENKGRIPLGEKGVGRFAAHRLGRCLTIKTKIAANDYEYVLKINWDDFSATGAAQKDLDSVPIVLTRQSPSRNYGARNSGTQLTIYGGREGFELTEDEIRAINKTILELNSPNPNPDTRIPSFRASFVCPQVKDLELRRPSIDPVFRLYGLVDENGVLDYDYYFEPPHSIPLSSFKQEKGKLDLKTRDSKKWLVKINNHEEWRKPACGEFYIHLDVWIRDKPWLGNSLDEKAFTDYLSDYGGISLYRDQINIFPAEWGSETDWLGLRQRQIQQARRMSYYHMIGNLEIDQSKNLDLIDKTNREGLIHNQAFSDLSDLVKAVVLFVETDYMGKRDEYKQLSGGYIREARQQKTFAKQSAAIIANMNASDYDVTTDPYRFFAGIRDLGVKAERHGKLVELSKSLKNLEENLRQIQEVQDMLTEQAGFGLGIAVVLHEISKTTSNFYFGVLDLIRKKKFDLAKLEELKETSRALESELTRLAPLRALRNELPIIFKVSRSISYVESIFKRRFDKLRISFSYNHDQDFEICAKYSALNQILTNLIDNSVYWLNNPDNKQRRIQLAINRTKRTIIVADSGPGLADSILPYIFQPGYSLKNPPSGLGLYVSRYYMNLMKRRGDIYLANESDRISDLPGAQFVLDFSKVEASDEK
jgi:signal transduction histidine kinase